MMTLGVGDNALDGSLNGNIGGCPFSFCGELLSVHLLKEAIVGFYDMTTR
jgi:hypothetical protein